MSILKKVSSVVKEFKNLKSSHESVFSELKIAKKKWLGLDIYQPPTPENFGSFFEELTDSLSKVANFMKTLAF